MELVLNLEWLILAAGMLLLWVRHARRSGARFITQFVSLTLVLLVMFTVIGIYDDMELAQNPSEARCFQREDDFGSHANIPIHSIAWSVSALSAKCRFTNSASTSLEVLVVECINSSPYFFIQNRPPPQA